MSAVWCLFELNEADCQMCNDKASPAELRETDCTAQPPLMKGKEEHPHTVVIREVIQVERIICHHLFLGTKRVRSTDFLGKLEHFDTYTLRIKLDSSLNIFPLLSLILL